MKNHKSPCSYTIIYWSFENSILWCRVFQIEFVLRDPKKSVTKIVNEFVVGLVTLVFIQVLGNGCCVVDYFWLNSVLNSLLSSLLSSLHWYWLKFWVIVVVVWYIYVYICGMECLLFSAFWNRYWVRDTGIYWSFGYSLLSYGVNTRVFKSPRYYVYNVQNKHNGDFWEIIRIILVPFNLYLMTSCENVHPFMGYFPLMCNSTV